MVTQEKLLLFLRFLKFLKSWSILYLLCFSKCLCSHKYDDSQYYRLFSPFLFLNLFTCHKYLIIFVSIIFDHSVYTLQSVCCWYSFERAREAWLKSATIFAPFSVVCKILLNFVIYKSHSGISFKAKHLLVICNSKFGHLSINI